MTGRISSLNVIRRNPLSRRRMLGRAAGLGLAASSASLFGGRSYLLAAQPADNSVRWVSPRGTIDVLDDYPYWVALAMGYFGDIQTTLEPGPIEATAGTKAVDTGQADMAFPSPGVFSLMIEQGIPLVSVFQMGAYDVFDFAFQKGQRPESLTALEGKTIVLGSAGWQGITNPILAQAGVDISQVSYVDAGQTWGQALAQGQADAALAWEGLRAQWRSTGLDFDYILGLEWSRFPANSFVIRQADAEDTAMHDIYSRYLRGWAMGLEFGHHNPLAATQITVEARPALNEVFPDKAVAVESMWELANVFRGDWPAREGWGWHSVDAWNLFLETTFDIGQLTEAISADAILTNNFIAAANDFDHDQVIADAVGYELNEEFAGLSEPEGTGTDGAIIQPGGMDATPAN
ncbi:MAG: ABC transporter substrate-binding protein [Chloroflexota bacterium]|nr:ABC transporter substrate-binding protein [Chloroflexota bacterium]